LNAARLVNSVTSNSSKSAKLTDEFVTKGKPPYTLASAAASLSLI